VVGIITKFLVAQVANLVALDNDTKPRVTHHRFSGDVPLFFEKKHPWKCGMKIKLETKGNLCV
jgi:hypothetical protein